MSQVLKEIKLKRRVEEELKRANQREYYRRSRATAKALLKADQDYSPKPINFKAEVTELIQSAGRGL